MSEQVRGEVTQILVRIESGDEAARDELLSLAYEELRSMAAGMMRRERSDHTLQPTAVVNEAVLRLLGEEGLQNVRSRAYFFGVMATAMRRVLVDHARRRDSQRRGGGQRKKSLELAIDQAEGELGVDLVALDDALQRLGAVSGRQAEIVTLRYFGGLSMPEIAEHLDVSLSTIEKDWKVARAWLRRELAAD